MAQKAGYWPQRAMGVASGILIFIVAYALMWHVDKSSELDSVYLMITGGLVLYIILLLPLMFICELFRKSATPIANIATTLMGVVYVAMPLSLLLFIPLLLGGGEWKPWTLLFYIFIIWANDVFAYLFGISFGKHRLFERISPKKSWEGFFGGLLGAMAMGFVAAKVLDANVAMWIGLALIAAITGVFGDLVESLLKRSVDVKDSGSFIPGHGGWLDRFDALIFSVPFAFIYLVIVEFI
jgi:phosphatidate cytidylyltransferase